MIVQLTGPANAAAANTGGSTLGPLPNPTSNNFLNLTGGVASLDPGCSSPLSNGGGCRSPRANRTATKSSRAGRPERAEHYEPVAVHADRVLGHQLLNDRDSRRGRVSEFRSRSGARADGGACRLRRRLRRRLRTPPFSLGLTPPGRKWPRFRVWQRRSTDTYADKVGLGQGNLRQDQPQGLSKDLLVFRTPRRPRERDHVADVRHAAQEQQRPLQPQSEPGVRHRAVAAQVQVPASNRAGSAPAPSSALRARRAAPPAGCRR